MDSISIFIDGGCKNNGTSNAEAYGSMAVCFKGEVKRTERWAFRNALTNNEAEYGALMSAFNYLLAEPKRMSYPVVIRTDSQLVWGQCTQGWKVKAENLRKRNQAAQDFLAKHKNVTIKKVGRDEVVKVLGH